MLDASRAYFATRADALENDPPKSIDELLGVEGAIAGDYFRAWSGIKLSWKTTRRHPIPNDRRTYLSRAALRAEEPRNFKGTHPVNAMLNYAYAILTARTQVQLIADGYDPTIGIMHDRYKGTHPDSLWTTLSQCGRSLIAPFSI